MKCCAMDLGHLKIRVNTIGPGTVETRASYNHMKYSGLTIEEGRKAYS